MTLSRRAASLLSGLLLLAAGALAQTPLGQPTLEERKVQIWCATARFVYEDTGHPELKSQLQCGGTLKALENSIKSDNQRVYSALYQPLEVKGGMYKGLGSDNSRLQTLVREIINRLRTSPARKGNAARLQGVTSLETALKNYVDNGTPIGELAAAEAPPETVDTTAATDEATAAVPGDAGLDEAGVATPVTQTNTGAGESLMNKFFGPLALILSLLSLVLYALMRRNIGAFQKELSARIDKRRDEILALQNSPAGGSARTAGSSVAAADRLTPAQQQQVEKLVQQRVEEELQKLRGQLSAAAPERATPAVPSNPAPAVAPPATPQATPEPPAPVVAPVSAPVAAVYAAPAQPAEMSAVPPRSTTDTSSASSQEEFESLVPSVQLPTPPVAPNPANQPQTRYVKVPVNGAFSEYDFSDEPQHDSIYEIYLDPQWPELATFSVTANPAVHAYAIQSAQYSLREACKYQQPSGPVTRIVTEEEGVLRKVAGAWQIEQKAAIRFE
ncbi:hypothetical protein HNQ93_003107 [Hymenobacter luteus]|uniref:Uncharacterized protein n=2 Tax=Hymenobacter TaxID=89966 RepID=A0A7W9T278_9BACT|nr:MULTISPECIES: hypothetical protein [Hymenobacter]MBB4602349.1 hypothetical protein [Hymenobacter latericoloratus]MBB6060241.1 hypothetical protein [Hymenobacter luteus]